MITAEQEARENKARRLADAIFVALPNITDSDVAALAEVDESVRAKVAVAARTHEPSDETWERVVAICEHRRARERALTEQLRAYFDETKERAR